MLQISEGKRMGSAMESGGGNPRDGRIRIQGRDAGAGMKRHAKEKVNRELREMTWRAVGAGLRSLIESVTHFEITSQPILAHGFLK